MRINLIAFLFVLAASNAFAQTTQTPQQHLEAAARILLNTAAAADSDVGRQLATLQRDFSDLSTTASAASATNWRDKYAKVESELKGLLATAGVNDELRKQLESFRSELELFYTSSLGQPPIGDPVARPDDATRVPDTTAPPTVASAAPCLTTEEVQTMTALLDRISGQVVDARSDKDGTKTVGTSGKDPGEVKVSMSAASLDEIKAEIAQVKQMLQQLRRP